MWETRYKIWAWGKPTKDAGRNEQHFVGLHARAKRSRINPYEISNELMCMRLAHAIKLPVPAGVVIEKQGVPYFASLEDSLAPETIPAPTDAEIATIVRNDPRLACGTIVFDAWICNDDRGNQNVYYEEESEQFYLIDHGSSPIFGAPETKAKQELNDFRSQLLISHKNNCFAKLITNLDDFDDWHSRILSIPEYYLRETAAQSLGFGYTKHIANFVVEFLIERRAQLRSLFANEYRSAFPSLDRDLLDPFIVPEPPEYQI
jgi:hypothetical protein